MVTRTAALCAALFIVLNASVLAAQDVTLRSRDGAIELTGNLRGFDGAFYRVETLYGELTVDGSGVTCEGVACPSLTDYVADVSISGSATVGRVLMPALIEGFALQRGYETRREPVDSSHFRYVISERDGGRVLGYFRFRLTNTDEGFADLLVGEADIAMSLREIRPQEAEMAKAEGLGDLTGVNRSRVVALDGLVPVVAPFNPVEVISPADLVKVLTGEITNWSALGGSDAPLVLHLRDPASGLSQGLEDRVLSAEGPGLREDALRHTDNVALARAISEDPLGLGIVSFSAIGDSKPLALDMACGPVLRATARSIKTADYPWTAPIFLYLPARHLPALVRDFLTFTRSAPAHRVIRRAGFMDQDPQEIAVELQGHRLAQAISVADGPNTLTRLKTMAEQMSQSERVTASFRFDGAGDDLALDGPSRSSARQLARSLEAGRFDGRALHFVGFSDAGEASGLDAQRAQAVLDSVVSYAGPADLSQVDFNTLSYGSAMPLSCADSAWSRHMNARVEIWVD